MAMPQEAIQLNNQAVAFLERSLFNEAILSSCAALETLERHLQTNTAVDQEVSLQQENSDDSVDQIILNHNHKSPPADDIAIMNDDEFIYDQGIVLPTTSGTSPRMDPKSAIFPVLIFNCALSHQLAGRHYCNDENGTSRKYLEKAKRLYQLAFEVRDAFFEVQDQGSSRNGRMLFQFAIVNNVGLIYKGLGNYDESKRCFENLVSMMMVYVDVGVESKRLQPIEGFWKNVVLENGQSMMPPAA